jgi:hypothetical protein
MKFSKAKCYSSIGAITSTAHSLIFYTVEFFEQDNEYVGPKTYWSLSKFSARIEFQFSVILIK